jgi:metal-responsive CopG/Arc/MetJ family transcriptional regulator
MEKKVKSDRKELITAMLPPVMLKKLDAMAEEESRTRSNLIRMAVAEFLEKRTGEKISVN